MTSTLGGLDDYCAHVRTDYSEQLARLVNVPTVSSDPAHAKDILHGAEVARNILTEAGFQAAIENTAGNPIVIGELIQDPSYPTVLLYGHMDVQPADMAIWNSDPFRFTEKDGRFYGRGATDDKGPSLSVLYAVRYAADKKLPVNFKIVWEHEEEIGSPHFGAFLEQHKESLQADSALVSDSVWLSTTQPTVDYGLRGLLTFEISLQTASREAHSGLVGGPARNPLGELSQIISECYDAKSGKVHIPGFYDGILVPSGSEIENFVDSGFDVALFRQAHGLQSLRTDHLRHVVSKVMAEPTFEVHGFVGGYTGPGVKTIIPGSATAKLSTRLVPGQNPEQIAKRIKEYITGRHPDVDVRFDAMAPPYLGAFTGRYADAARQAITDVFGTPPAFIRQGGSIGAVVSMDRILQIPIVLIGLSLPEHGYHADNEYFDWNQVVHGIKVFANYFEIISRQTG